jgi:hypothetical protein
MIEGFGAAGSDEGSNVGSDKYVIDAFGASRVGGWFVIHVELGLQDVS